MHDMAKKKHKSIVPQAKIIVQIIDDDGTIGNEYTANTKQEAEAMVYAFHEAFDLCGNSCLSAKIK
jgi:copper homeostasis protein CutC